MLSPVGQWLFDSSDLTPHGFCLLWEPGLIWTYALSDIGIAVAYFSIPLALSVFAYRRRDAVFRPLLWLFAAFIVLCGSTHILDVVTLWLPVYGLQAVTKAATAIVSISCAIFLWRLLPEALTLPSPAQMRAANAELLASREQLFQAQKMDAVGQMTGGIAHDFNNILQTISGALELIELRIAQGRADSVKRYSDAVHHAVATATSLTHRLLAFSRRQALQPRAVDPDRLIEGMAELIRRSLGPAIQLEIRLRDGKWSAMCDPNQLESAILNLAINARDAMPDGGTLSIGACDRVLAAADIPETEVPPGRFLEIVVADTGFGMDEETLRRAFEPFYSKKATGGGTGLGLSQVYGFVRQSGGFVRLESSPGNGAVVRLFLPAREAPAETPAADARGGASNFGETDAHGRKVLLVEDNDQIRIQIFEALTDRGFEVLTAEDGARGLQILDDGAKPDLLVTDIGLPIMNGRQVADAARAKIPKLPVLLITGYAGACLGDGCFDEGMEMLTKPFLIEDLVAKAIRLLGSEDATIETG